MRRSLAIVSLMLVLPLALPANEFDWLVREFARESGTKPLHIPFFGLARFAVTVGHPAGASQLNLAVFENTNLDSSRFSAFTDGVVGRAWRPLVRVRSRHGESTNIYAHGDAKQLHLLITTFDHGEATFVQVKIQPETLMKFIDEHQCRR